MHITTATNQQQASLEHREHVTTCKRTAFWQRVNHVRSTERQVQG